MPLGCSLVGVGDRNTVLSSKGDAAICSPTGRLSFVKPQGREIAGKPVRLNGLVKLGRRFCSLGSMVSKASGGRGADGVTKISTAKKFARIWSFSKVRARRAVM